MDNSLPQAFSSLGLVNWFDLNLKRSEQDFLKALALNRSYSEGYHYYAHLLASRGESAKGFENMEKAIDLSPTWTLNQYCYGMFYIHARRYREAEMHFERMGQQDSASSDGDLGLFRVLLFEGKIDKATETALRLASRYGAQPSELEFMLARVAAKAGRREEALARVQHLEELADKEKDVHGEQFDPFSFARIYASLGMKEEALEWIERSFFQHSNFLVNLNIAPEFDTLRGDARFTAFLRRAGFLE